jgi:hypothetical protein
MRVPDCGQSPKSWWLRIVTCIHHRQNPLESTLYVGVLCSVRCRKNKSTGYVQERYISMCIALCNRLVRLRICDRRLDITNKFVVIESKHGSECVDNIVMSVQPTAIQGQLGWHTRCVCVCVCVSSVWRGRTPCGLRECKKYIHFAAFPTCLLCSLSVPFCTCLFVCHMLQNYDLCHVTCCERPAYNVSC